MAKIVNTIASMIASLALTATATAQDLSASETLTYISNSLDFGYALQGDSSSCRLKFFLPAGGKDYFRVEVFDAANLNKDDIKFASDGNLIIAENFSELVDTGSIDIEYEGTVGLFMLYASSESNTIFIPLVSFKSPRDQTAYRVSKALKHLIDICDDDPFK